MNRRALQVVLLALAAATGACAVESAARGSTAPAATADGGDKASPGKTKAPAATEPHPAPDAGSGRPGRVRPPAVTTKSSTCPSL